MSERKPTIAFSDHALSEEMANVVTHGIAVGMSIVGLIILIMSASLVGDIYRTIGVIVYGCSLILLYMASTTFHAFQRPSVNRTLRHITHIADHIGIFILIAGTYTPILLGPLRGHGGITFLVFIWSVALIGSIIKVFFTGRFNKVTTLAYVAMGWSAVFMIGTIAKTMGSMGLMWIVLGGVIYTVGVIPYLWHRLPYNHAIWHLFVMAGSLCHFLGILWYVVPPA